MSDRDDREESLRRRIRALLERMSEAERQALRDRDPEAIAAADRLLQAEMTPEEMAWAVETGALMALEELPDDSPAH